MAEKRTSLIVCRCEEITDEEVRKAVKEGATSVDAVKRVTRAGMGLCQSKICYLNIAKIIHEETGIPVSKLIPIKHRIPVRPVKIGDLDN
ncbi:MAG: (2Fe-2S)-binding protein [Actinobacteria bacterium]|nr:(2Fe-2S)-binding protein [Actinomycetota bacterium]